MRHHQKALSRASLQKKSGTDASSSATSSPVSNFQCASCSALVRIDADLPLLLTLLQPQTTLPSSSLSMSRGPPHRLHLGRIMFIRQKQTARLPMLPEIHALQANQQLSTSKVCHLVFQPSILRHDKECCQNCFYHPPDIISVISAKIAHNRMRGTLPATFQTNFLSLRFYRRPVADVEFHGHGPSNPCSAKNAASTSFSHSSQRLRQSSPGNSRISPCGTVCT